MDDKFLNNDDNLELNNDEEMVLFSRENDAADELSDIADDTADAVMETSDREAEPDFEVNNEEPEAVDNEDIPVAKKTVEAPKKTKSEKTQTVLFVVVIALGILAFIILIVAGLVTVAKNYGLFDKVNQIINEAEGNTDAAQPDTSKVQYSLYLENNGYIKDIKASDYVELCDYKNIVIDYNDIKPAESEIQEQIDSVLASFESIDTETDKVTELGDTLNIDYVGTVDGVAFEGGDTKGGGAELTLGSRSYIDDFEEQLVGYKVGDNVTVEVTFPENYGNEALNGKDAVFEVTINGIYTTPEFTDEFVQTNLSDFASTADEYRQYIEDALAENNKVNYVWNYVVENSAVNEYPQDYFNNELEVYDLEMENQYNYYNEYYYAMTGQYMWDDKYAFYEVDEAGYEDMVKDYAEKGTKQALITQAIAEDGNTEVTEDDLLTYLTGIGYDSASYETIAEKYGEGYIYQQALYTLVEDMLLENTKVNK